MAVKEYEKLFPKRFRKHLIEALPIEERAQFIATVSGWRWASRGEKKRWYGIMKSLSVVAQAK